jgi:hypothetical protein
MGKQASRKGAEAQRKMGRSTLCGKDGDDAKKYQEAQVKRAIEEVQP